MESYREKLKLENWILGVSCFLLAAFCLVGLLAEGNLVELTPMGGDVHWQSRWRGGITGASFALLVMLAVILVRNCSAIRDERKLKKLYVKAHDERTIQVQTSALAAGCRSFLILGLVAALIAGYFHMVVSLTILACVFALSILCVLFKLYYLKKF